MGKLLFAPLQLSHPLPLAQEPYLQSQCDCCSYRLDPENPVRILNLRCPGGRTELVVLPVIHSCQCSACQGGCWRGSRRGGVLGGRGLCGAGPGLRPGSGGYLRPGRVTRPLLAGISSSEFFCSAPFPFLAFLLVCSPITLKPRCSGSGISGSNPSSSVSFLAEPP